MAEEEYDEVEAFRKAVARRIVADADRLVDELFAIAYDGEAGARDKLSAITILLDRALPKLGVQHTKEEETEEKGSRKDLREEIERLLREEDDDDDGSAGVGARV